MVGIRNIFGVAILTLLASPSLLAQDHNRDSISATNAEGVLRVLENAGYDAELVERDEDNSRAYVKIETGSGLASVLFSDCNDAVPDFCETLILSTWWDRETPISDEALAAANRNHKYVTVFRRNSGDPVMQWALLTRREGIPATVFLNALQRFSGIARDFRDVAFEGDDLSPEAEAEAETSTLSNQAAE